jgi:hypothetical protein
MDLTSLSLSSQRLLLKSFTRDDAREAFLAATPTIARFMSWEPAPSLEAFERIWQSWIPKMRAGTDVSLTVRHQPSLEFRGIAGLHNTDAVLGAELLERDYCERPSASSIPKLSIEFPPQP